MFDHVSGSVSDASVSFQQVQVDVAAHNTR